MTDKQNTLSNDRAWALFYRDKKSVEEIAAELAVPESDVRSVADALAKPLAALTEFTLRKVGEKDLLIGNLTGLIRGLEATVECQDRLIINLTTALDDLSGRKKAEREAAKAAAAQGFKFKRNKSWLQSAKLGLAHGLWWAPTELVADLKMPVVGLLMGALMLIGRLSSWVLERPALVIGGLCGYVSPPPKPPA